MVASLVINLKKSKDEILNMSFDDFESPKSKKLEVYEKQYGHDKKSSYEKVISNFNKNIVLEMIENYFKMMKKKLHSEVFSLKCHYDKKNWMI